MGKIASETAELLKEIILSCSAEDILPEELDNFIDFLANVSDSNANEPQAIDKTGAEVLFLTSFLTEELEKDFPEIETDFIFHSRAKLPQFGRDAIPLELLQYHRQSPAKGPCINLMRCPEWRFLLCRAAEEYVQNLS